MSINSVIRNAVTGIGIPCMPDYYAGEEKVYCTFNYTEYPRDFADNGPQEVLYDVQVHLFLPIGMNPIALKKKIRDALVAEGVLYPTILNLTDQEYQHYVFECEYEGTV